MSLLKSVLSMVGLGESGTATTRPAHTSGVPEGNALPGAKHPADLTPDGHATAQRSTGINPEARLPIDSRMPNLPPS
jgi:hypothetical protein